MTMLGPVLAATNGSLVERDDDTTDNGSLVWEPTNHFRWWKQAWWTLEPKILEQLWTTQNGRKQWKPVETVEG